MTTPEEELFIQKAIKNGAVIHFSECVNGDTELQFILAVRSMAGLHLTKAMKIRALQYLLEREKSE